MSCVRKSVLGLSLSVALCVAPTAAVAAQNTPVQAINPMIALSLFGSPASAAALCGNQAAAVAGAAVAAAQAPAPGCVLPYADPVAPPPMAEPVAVPPEPIAAAAPRGFGVAPLLLGLLGIAGLAAIIASQDDDDNGDPPVSPN
jgi:hypothetical protein